MLLLHVPLSAPLFLVTLATYPADEWTLCFGIGLAGGLMLPHSFEMFEGLLPAELAHIDPATMGRACAQLAWAGWWKLLSHLGQWNFLSLGSCALLCAPRLVASVKYFSQTSQK